VRGISAAGLNHGARLAAREATAKIPSISKVFKAIQSKCLPAAMAAWETSRFRTSHLDVPRQSAPICGYPRLSTQKNRQKDIQPSPSSNQTKNKVKTRLKPASRRNNYHNLY
jgi:hypothetical protein